MTILTFHEQAIHDARHQYPIRFCSCRTSISAARVGRLSGSRGHPATDDGSHDWTCFFHRLLAIHFKTLPCFSCIMVNETIDEGTRRYLENACIVNAMGVLLVIGAHPDGCTADELLETASSVEMLEKCDVMERLEFLEGRELIKHEGDVYMVSDAYKDLASKLLATDPMTDEELLSRQHARPYIFLIGCSAMAMTKSLETLSPIVDKYSTVHGSVEGTLVDHDDLGLGLDSKDDNDQDGEKGTYHQE